MKLRNEVHHVQTHGVERGGMSPQQVEVLLGALTRPDVGTKDVAAAKRVIDETLQRISNTAHHADRMEVHMIRLAPEYQAVQDLDNALRSAREALGQTVGERVLQAFDSLRARLRSGSGDSGL